MIIHNAKKPHLQDYPEAGKVFDLQKMTLKPAAVALAKGVMFPAALLEENTEVYKQSPDTVTRVGSPDEDSHLIFDFGVEWVGDWKMEVQAEKESKLEILYGEDFDEAQAEWPYGCQWYRRPCDAFELEEGSHRLSNPGRRAGRYLHVKIAAGGLVKVNQLEVLHRNYPVQERGHFSCSDTRMNRIWNIASRTTRLCMQQFYEDGIKRDGILWAGDYRIQFLCNLFPFGDYDLARKSLYLLAACQTENGAIPANAFTAGGCQPPHGLDYMPYAAGHCWILPTYCGEWLSSVCEYYQFSGDEGTLDRLWDAVVRQVRFLAKEMDWDNLKMVDDYLTDNQYDIDADWWGALAHLHGVIYKGVRDVSLLAQQRKDSEAQEQCSEVMKEMARRLNENLEGNQRRFFSDDPARPEDRPSLQSQAAVCLSGLMESSEECRAILKRVLEHPEKRHPVSGYQQFWVQEALWHFGLKEEALRMARDWYGHHLDMGAATCWEKLDIVHGERPTINYSVSQCHGWSAGTNYQFPRYILGINPVEPGWRRVVLEPWLADLEWAEGGVSTPAGQIYVHWERRDGLQGRIEIPEGMTAVVRSGHSGENIELSAGSHNIHLPY
jgi:hypothetical protein